MYARRFVLMILGLTALALSAGRADAGLMAGSGDPFVFNFDENGNGSVSVNGGAFQPLNGSLMPDPTNGDVPALTYLLPSLVVTGNQRIFEDAGMTILGDAFRWTNASGDLSAALNGDRLIFYSALGGGTLADTGFPANISTGHQNPPIVENADGTIHFAPGGASDNIYNAVSDATAVPEPSTLALLTLGGLGLAGWRRWKGRRQQNNPAA
jgi:hypothetical protein